MIGNDGWQHAVGDVFGVHDYAPTGEMLRERYADRATIARTFREVRPHHHPLLGEGIAIDDEPIVISEFGGSASFRRAPRIGSATASSPMPMRCSPDMKNLSMPLLASTALAGFCYTQLTDTAQETNGLLTVNREPKFDVERLRAINSRPSKAVPSEILDVLIKQEVERRRRERGQE